MNLAMIIITWAKEQSKEYRELDAAKAACPDLTGRGAD
jgi:hypothetical protein